MMFAPRAVCSFVALIVSAGFVQLVAAGSQGNVINTFGSSMCLGHHGRLLDLRYILKQAVPDTIAPYVTVTGDKTIGCIPFGAEKGGINRPKDFTKVKRKGGGGGHGGGGHGDGDGGGGGGRAIGGRDYGTLGTGANGGGGAQAICAFFQGTQGASFNFAQIHALLKSLTDDGANPCGSVPVGYPAWNATGGQLTVNYVLSSKCNKFCSGEIDYPASAAGVVLRTNDRGYAPGACGIHGTVYERQDYNDPQSHYHITVSFKDANRARMGHAQYQELQPGVPFSMPNMTPSFLTFNATVDTSPSSDYQPLIIQYAGEQISTIDNQCNLQPKKDGVQSFDCGVPCGDELLPLGGG